MCHARIAAFEFEFESERASSAFSVEPYTFRLQKEPQWFAKLAMKAKGPEIWQKCCCLFQFQMTGLACEETVLVGSVQSPCKVTLCPKNNVYQHLHHHHHSNIERQCSYRRAFQCSRGYEGMRSLPKSFGYVFDCVHAP